MSFSVGLFDKLFGKKVELEIPDGNGNILKRTVTEKFYNKMLVEGKFSEVEEDTINVHMLHPIDGYVVLVWIIGEDIDMETVNKFIYNGELYALTVFEEGEQKVMVITKDLFEESYEQFVQV